MTGRGWAYVGAILGGAVSIAANVAHSYVPPAEAAPGWAPERGAIGSAVFWPVALFVAIEIMSRVRWPSGWRYAVVRFGGLVPVAVVAAVVSYRHLSGLLAFYGEDGLTVAVGPLAVDGLMVMATGALIATGSRRPIVEVPKLPAEVAAPPVPELPPSEPVVAAPDREPAGAEPSPVNGRKVPAVAAAVQPPKRPVRASVKNGTSRRREPRQTRRPVEETRRLAQQISADHPALKPAEVAAQLGITPRRLRAILADPTSTGRTTP